MSGDAEPDRSVFKRKKHSHFDPEKVLPEVSPDGIQLAPARIPPQLGFFDYFPIFTPIQALYKFGKNIVRKSEADNGRDKQQRHWTGKKIRRPVVESVVPLEIS